ncbi:MAG: hypothetical protein GX168_00955 [Bacteroidales bacterium]|jgi:hypothetical protein|nr:hypothetical protein [Bacteroidales bacterium]
MKKIFLLVVAGVLFASCEKETVLPMGEVPSEITSYTDTHFPEHPIVQVVKDNDGFELTYDVLLEGTISLEFNRKREVIDIDSPFRLPDSVIPQKILDYASANYADYFIVGWGIDDRNQQVKLNHGLELEFNMSGDFIRIDD